MFKKIISLSIITCLSFITNAQPFYVSIKGNDQNPGSKEKPFASLDKAKEAVKKCTKLSMPITVYLREGIYYLSKSFKLEKEDGGLENAPVIYSAYENETVTIRGSRPLQSSAFQKIKDNATLERIKPSLRDSIVMLDLNTAKIEHIKKYPEKFDDDE